MPLSSPRLHKPRETVDALSDVLGEWMPTTVELFEEMAPLQLTP